MILHVESVGQIELHSFSCRGLFSSTWFEHIGKLRILEWTISVKCLGSKAAILLVVDQMVVDLQRTCRRRSHRNGQSNRNQRSRHVRVVLETDRDSQLHAAERSATGQKTQRSAGSCEANFDRRPARGAIVKTPGDRLKIAIASFLVALSYGANFSPGLAIYIIIVSYSSEARSNAN